LEHYKNSADITNNYEVKSNGPSTIDGLEIVFHIPVAYKISGSTATIPIINVGNLSMQATYDSQLVSIELLDQNNTQIIMNTIEVSSTRSSTERGLQGQVARESDHCVQLQRSPDDHMPACRDADLQL